MLRVRFNQSHSCISVGTNKGFRIYSCEPFKKCYDSKEGGIGIVQMLFCSSLVALVGTGPSGTSARALRLFNTKSEQTICDLNFASTVLAPLLNRSRLVAVLEAKIHIFDLRSMHVLTTIDTAANSAGVCALSPSDQNCFMAFPASPLTGEVLIYDALNLQIINSIQAHQGPLRQLAFSKDGTMLATCSEHGTVVRVFAIPDGTKLHTFRRGTYPAVVNSLCFSLDSTQLCLSSQDSSTVHIFSLAPQKDPTPLQQTQSSTASAALSFLPTVLHDLMEPARGFARIDLKDSHAIACAFHENTVVVVTAAGYLYRYRVPAEGGTCKLESEHSLLEGPSEALGAKLTLRDDAKEGGGR